MSDGHWKKLREIIEARMMEVSLIPRQGVETTDVSKAMIYNELNKLVLAMDIIEKDICYECGGPLYPRGRDMNPCQCWNDE